MTNPYMGQPVELATGARGEVVNAQLLAHGASLQRRLHKVTNRVSCQLGSSLGNASMVLGQRGMIVIDTGDCVQQSAEQLEDFRRVTDRAVSALIYSHGHYALGARTYVQSGEEAILPIYAHRDLLQVMARTLGDLAPFMTRRVAMQFGMFLPHLGPDAMPNHGLGATFFALDRYTPTPGFVRPNRWLDDGQSEVIDGVRFQFWHAPADSDDTLLIWLPDDGVVINNIAWPVMFNIYTLRGEAFRNPTRLLPGLDRILELEPEHLVGVHGVPISGRAAVRQAVTEYRDCIQYTYDQTVRGINRGLSPDELVRFVQLPEALVQGRLTGQFYGELSYYVRQIYGGLVGWFGNDTVELHPLAQDESARRWAALAGGTERLLREAGAALERREYQWAAELATIALRAGTGTDDARQIKAQALRAMGQVTTASNTRSWYLTQARELEGQADTWKLPISFVSTSTVRQMPVQTYVNAMRFKLDPALSAEGPRRVNLHISEHAFTLLLRHGVAQVLPGTQAAADATIELSLDQWAALVAQQQNSQALIDCGVRIDGDMPLARAVLDAWQ